MTPVEGKTTEAAAEFNQHPLINFKADITDINESQRPQRNNPAKMNNFLTFDMADVEVIESREPYTFPTTQIEILEINIPGSNWEALKASIRKCGYSGDLNGLIGKRAHWQYTTAMLSQRNQTTQKFETKEGNCWQIVEIEGVENTSDKLLSAVLDIANGVDAATFKTNFLTNNDIRGYTGYPDMIAEVMNNKTLDLLVAAGKLSFDGTLYHKVG